MARTPHYELLPRLCLVVVLTICLTACAFQQTVITATESRARATETPPPLILRVWHTVSPEQAETLQAIANAWSRQQSHPVLVELQSYSGEESLHQNLLAAIQTQQTPDLAFIRPSDIHFYAGADALLPLHKFWNDLDSAAQTDFIAPFLETTHCAVNDKVTLWAIPTHRYQTVLYVNKSVLTGKLQGEAPPATWEELTARCADYVTQVNYVCLSIEPTSEMATLFFLSHNNPIVDTVSNESTLTEPSALTALHRLITLRTQGSAQLAISNEGMMLDFTGGRTLFAIESTGKLAEYTNAIGDKFEWEVVPLPSDGATPRTLANGGNIALFRSTSDREALALSFLHYLMGSEVNARWAEVMEAFPVRQSSLEPFLIRNRDPHIHHAAALLPEAYSVPCLPQWQAVESELTRLVTDTLNGVASPESLIAGAAQNMNTLFR